MLDNFVKEIEKELGTEEPILPNETGIFKIPMSEDTVIDASLSPKGNYLFKGIIGKCPQERTEEFLLRTMEANLFGKGTYGAAIGLTEDEKILTLSLEVDYNCSYKEWKEKLEDFYTVLGFWRNESAPPG